MSNVIMKDITEARVRHRCGVVRATGKSGDFTGVTDRIATKIGYCKGGEGNGGHMFKKVGNVEETDGLDKGVEGDGKVAR